MERAKLADLSIMERVIGGHQSMQCGECLSLAILVQVARTGRKFVRLN